MSPEALFKRYAPSLAFVETPSGHGTGILIEDGYVLTNAHVVLPYETVRITFPDRSEFQDVPVAHLDTLADLALLGPITTTLPALTLADGEDLPIGTEVYLLGYPGEVETFPEPTISKGLISRYREWDILGLTFIQTDAAAAGGQSGGILLTREGAIIGISGYTFADQKYVLVLSARDAQPLVDALRKGEVAERSPWVWVSQHKGYFTQNMEFSRAWTTVGFAIYEPVGTTVDLKFMGHMPAPEVEYLVKDPMGIYVVQNNLIADGVAAEFTIEKEGPYYLVVGAKEPTGNFAVESNVPLIRHPESQEDPLIQLGDTVYGVLDYPDDVDLYRLVLNKGDTVNIRVSSLMINPVLLIDLLDKPLPEESTIIDINSGKGLLGTDAEITFTAPERGTYALIVFDILGDVGGYALQVREPYKGAPTPTTIEPTPTPLPSSIGPVQLYTSETPPYVHIRYPANWHSSPSSPFVKALCEANPFSLCVTHPDGFVVLTVAEEDLAAYGIADLTMEEYVDLWKRLMGDKLTIVHEEYWTTKQGFKAHIVEATMNEKLVRIYRMTVLAEGKAVTVSFIVPPLVELLPGRPERFLKNELPAIRAYVFKSFVVER